MYPTRRYGAPVRANLIAMGPQLRPGIYRQIKSAAINDVHLLRHQRDQPDQPRRVSSTEYAPRAVKNEEYDFGSIERQAFAV